MALRRSTLRSSASLAIALVLVATASAGALAAPRGSAGTAAKAGGTTPTAAGKRLANDLKITRRPGAMRPSVNVRRLAAKKPTVREHRNLPFLSHDATTGGTTSGGPKVVLPAAPLPVQATDNSSPNATVTQFDGLAQDTSVDTAGEPPDPWVAVGPEHVVQAVNLAMRITDRQGVSSLPDVSLPDFFQLPPPSVIPTFDSDPHVIYDSLHGRWLATEVSWDCVPGGGATMGHGYIDFAVSHTSDPTGTWDIGFIIFDDVLPDFPAPGTTTDKIAVASNIFGMVPGTGADCVDATSPFLAGDVVYVDWADVLDLGTLDILETILPETDDTDPLHPQHWFTPRVAVQVPATSGRLHIVAQFDFGGGAFPEFTFGLGYLTLVGSVKANTLQLERVDSLTEEFPRVSEFVDPPAPNQPGTPPTIVDAVDSRTTDAIWQGNRLVLVSTAGCTPSGDSTVRDCVRVTELDTSTVPVDAPTLKQDFLVAKNGEDRYMGGVGLTGNGTLHIGWTESSATAGDFPSSKTAHQGLGDAINTISDLDGQALGTGDATYTGTRWGDYVGVAQDPQVPNQAWDANEFSLGASGWATKVSRLQTGSSTYIPIAPVRVLDTRANLGASGKFTSANARSWQVTGVGGIPAGAVAVTGNVTVTQQGSAGFVSVTVTSVNNPPSSTINFPLGQTRANNVTTALSPAGRLSAVFRGVSGKKTHLVFDVTGYFLADDTGATFNTVAPSRILDTRASIGLPGKFHANTARTLQVTGAGGVPAGATAITGNLTMVSPSKLGYAAVTKDPDNTPPNSTINFPAGSVRANGVFAPLDSSGQLSIVYKATAGATSHILLDVTGYFMDDLVGLRFVPLNPSRIMDSRSSAVLSGVSGAFHSGTPKTLTVQGHWGVPIDAVAVTGNLTVNGQTARGYVSATPDPVATPPTSTINFLVGDTMANGIVAPLNLTGHSSFVYRGTPSAGKVTHLILDLSGYFE